MSSARKKTAEEINLDYIAGQPNVVWPYRGGQTFVEQRPCRFCRRFHGPRWHEIACECLHYTLNAHKVKCGDATLWQIERARRILGARRIGDKVDGNGFLPNCTCLGSQFQWLSSAGGKRQATDSEEELELDSDSESEYERERVQNKCAGRRLPCLRKQKEVPPPSPPRACKYFLSPTHPVSTAFDNELLVLNHRPPPPPPPPPPPQRISCERQLRRRRRRRRQLPQLQKRRRRG